MVLARQKPFRGMEEMNDLLENWFGNGGLRSGLEGRQWIPSTDIYEEGDDLVIEVEAPGMTRDDFEVFWEDGRLTIEGDRREEKTMEEEERNYLRSERTYGAFKRSFRLPDDVDPDQIHAEYQNGVLTLRLPKPAQVRKKSIRVS